MNGFRKRICVVLSYSHVPFQCIALVWEVEKFVPMAESWDAVREALEKRLN